jgi:hypothetical protein
MPIIVSTIPIRFRINDIGTEVWILYHCGERIGKRHAERDETCEGTREAVVECAVVMRSASWLQAVNDRFRGMGLKRQGKLERLLSTLLSNSEQGQRRAALGLRVGSRPLKARPLDANDLTSQS